MDGVLTGCFYLTVSMSYKSCWVFGEACNRGFFICGEEECGGFIM